MPSGCDHDPGVAGQASRWNHRSYGRGSLWQSGRGHGIYARSNPTRAAINYSLLTINCSLRCLRLAEHFPRMVAGGLGDFHATEHACQFLDAGGFVQQAESPTKPSSLHCRSGRLLCPPGATTIPALPGKHRGGTTAPTGGAPSGNPGAGTASMLAPTPPAQLLTIHC